MRLMFLCTCLVAACGPAAPSKIKPLPEPTPEPAPAPTPAPPSEAPVTIPTQTAKPQELAFPTEAFRSEQPKAGAPRPFRFPAVKQFTLASGIKVYLVEQHALPLISIDLNFDGGGITDPAGKEGLSGICMSMLTEGTEKLDKIKYSEALADVASNISAYAGDDSIGITMSSLSKHLAATFAVFVDTLRAPAFRASDFERMVKRRIESVRQAKGSPAGVSGRVFSSVLFGRAHPLGTVVTEQTLQAITVDDCKKLAASYLKPAGARLFVVGDLTEAQIRQLFEGPELAAWKGAGPKVAAPPAPKTMAGRIFFVNVPNAAQSVVTLAHFGPRRDAADYFPTTMMGSVFGGSFSSRINMNLREDKGYSYGARGGFQYTKTFGWFTASASVRSDSTYQTLREIQREVSELAQGKRPVVKAELDREKQGAILGLPGQFATGQQALGNYRRLVYYGLPMDYYAKFTANVDRVDEAATKAAAARHLKPDGAFYLVVGDGDAKMKVRSDGKDVDMVEDGKPVTLRRALESLVASKTLGAGELVVLDADALVAK